MGYSPDAPKTIKAMEEILGIEADSDLSGYTWRFTTAEEGELIFGYINGPLGFNLFDKDDNPDSEVCGDMEDSDATAEEQVAYIREVIAANKVDITVTQKLQEAERARRSAGGR